MDSLCWVTNKDHVKEYYEIRDGMAWLKCKDCGEQFFDRYHDCGSGG